MNIALCWLITKKRISKAFTYQIWKRSHIIFCAKPNQTKYAKKCLRKTVEFWKKFICFIFSLNANDCLVRHYSWEQTETRKEQNKLFLQVTLDEIFGQNQNSQAKLDETRRLGNLFISFLEGRLAARLCSHTVLGYSSIS